MKGMTIKGMTIKGMTMNGVTTYTAVDGRAPPLLTHR